MKNLTKLKQEKYQAEFKPTHLRINGTAILNLWGGGQGEIQMHCFYLVLENIKDKQDLISQIKENANDHGFGCESIDSLRKVSVEVLSTSALGTLCTDIFTIQEINFINSN